MSELDELLSFWKATLSENRYLLSPSTIFLIEGTIKALGELKKLKGGD